MVEISATPANKRSTHTTAVLQALFVTFLWSTSWVLIKVGLEDIPALTFAGLRYMLAFLCLLPFTLARTKPAEWRSLTRGDWLRLVLLGVLYIAITQGAQFLALAYLPAVSVSLLLNLTTSLVALSGIVLLAEYPSVLQWGGIFLNLVGILIYFYPASLPGGKVFGIIVALTGVTAKVGSSILARRINRAANITPLQVTTVSMGFGAVLLLGTGIATQGLPHLSFLNWAAIAWLAVVNTAFTFPLWNKTLRVLTAVESSIINNTMLIQIALLVWIFLGESITWKEGFGMLLAAAGALLVQLRLKQKKGSRSGIPPLG
jgi:drug/metabolite transporter (DMT)-like permease